MLSCLFKLASEDTGPLDIEWSQLASDNQKDDKVVSACMRVGERARVQFLYSIFHIFTPCSCSSHLTGFSI